MLTTGSGTVSYAGLIKSVPPTINLPGSDQPGYDTKTRGGRVVTLVEAGHMDK
jgi:hypothetical protein